MASLAILPVFFKLIGKRVVVAGGSDAAAWKAELLAACGASIDVFAPDTGAKLRALVEGWGKKARMTSMYFYGWFLAEPTAPNPMTTKWVTDAPIVLANNCRFWQPETIPNFETSMHGLYLGVAGVAGSLRSGLRRRNNRARTDHRGAPVFDPVQKERRSDTIGCSKYGA